MNNLINFILTFALIYDINFRILPGITTCKIAVFFLILSNLTHVIHLFRSYKLLFLIVLLLLLFSFSQSLFSRDHEQFVRLLYFTVYCLTCSYLLAKRYSSLSTFLFSLLIGTSLQSIILIYGFWNPNFKYLLDSFIIYTANFDVEYLYRAFGLSSWLGVNLSLMQSLGFAAGLFLLYKKNNKYIIIIPLCVLSGLSTIFVGRTGFLLSILFLAIYLFFSFKKRKLVALCILIFMSPVVLNIRWLDIFARQLDKIDNFSSDYFITWLSEGVQISNNRTVNALMQEQKIPPLTLKNIFIGSGTITTKNGWNSSGHDSGYIQTYYSLGLLPALMFYLSFILFVYKSFKKYNAEIVYLIIFIMLVLEIKEPILFKYSEGIILLTFLWIIKNNYSNNQKIKKSCVVSM